MKLEMRERNIIRRLNYVRPLVKMTADLGVGLQIPELHHPCVTAKCLTPGKSFSYFLLVLLKNIMTTYQKVNEDLNLADEDCTDEESTCQSIT